MFRLRRSMLATLSMVAHVYASRAAHSGRVAALDYIAASRRFTRFFAEPSAVGASRVATVIDRAQFGKLHQSLPAAEQRLLRARGVKEHTPDAVLVVGGGKEEEVQEYLMCDDATRVYGVSAFPALLHGDKPYELRSFDGADFSAEEQTNMALSWALGCYKFNAYKTDANGRAAKGAQFAQLCWPKQCDRKFVMAAARATFLARDMINTPAEDMSPSKLEETARAAVAEFGASVTSVVGDDLLAKNFPQTQASTLYMGCSMRQIHAVGRAAGPGREPRIIDIAWGDTSHPRVTLVGKGVCFDTGGLNIKTMNMGNMKKDMSGAAQALALGSMIMEMNLPVRLRILLPVAENSVSANSIRPGDIIRARNGKTTEITNTDAEGRLILADALVEACSEDVNLLVDFATLTGAANVALGFELPAVFANRPELAVEMMRHGERVQDRVWNMPLYDGYRKYLDSNIADIKNSAEGRNAGAITAALYLHEFVKGRNSGSEPDWVHVDFSATHADSKPGRQFGFGPMGLRAAYELIRSKFVR